MNIYTPYTYLIGWSDLNKYYYGMRYAKQKCCLYETGCHPNDLWITYFTSSKEVSIYRKKYGEPDIVQIRRTFSNAKSAKIWEHNVLLKLKAATSDKWLNKTYAMVEFNLHEYNTGKKRSNEQKIRMSVAQKGRTISKNHAKKISNATKGRKPWNTGKTLTGIKYKTTAKKWIICNLETKHEFSVFSLREWCIAQHLNYQAFHRNIKQNRPYKNYTAREVC
jgi:hypothetical protein